MGFFLRLLNHAPGSGFYRLDLRPGLVFNGLNLTLDLGLSIRFNTLDLLKGLVPKLTLHCLDVLSSLVPRISFNFRGVLNGLTLHFGHDLVSLSYDQRVQIQKID